MAKKITWSPDAREEFKTILDYLLTEWSESFAERFSEEVSRKIDLLTEQPFMGKATDLLSSVRFISINRQYTLYYVVLDDSIWIANLIHANKKR
jgi:plasmid stabilization system protein ParE